MSIFNGQAKAPGGNEFEKAPSGSHAAVLCAIIDLGSRMEVFRDEKTGKDKEKLVRKIYFAWELTTCKMSGTKARNHVIGREFSLSFDPKGAMRKTLESMRGAAYKVDDKIDVSKFLGFPCLVSVVHKTAKNSDNVYAKFDGAIKLPGGMPKPAGTLTPIIWEIGKEPFPDVAWLPDTYHNTLGFVSLKRIVETSPEWKELHGSAPASAAPATNGNGHPVEHESSPFRDEEEVTAEPPF